MGTCDTCGNEYDKSFEIDIESKRYTFDCFECAIQMLAPECENCGCRIIGHGTESDGVFFCCAHCAEEAGGSKLVDRT